MLRNKSVEEIQIQNWSDRRYELFGQEYPDWDWEEEETLHPTEVEKEIDDLADKILDSIKRHHHSLPFEFVFEELTKLGWAPCLLYDDDGHFCITGDGMEEMSVDETNEDKINVHALTHFVDEKKWYPTIREALKAYLEDDE